MTYSATDKFTQPSDGIVIITAGPTNEELVEIAARVAQGEDRAAVIAEIELRVEQRNVARRKALEGDTGGLV
jgi:hypothetical protein